MNKVTTTISSEEEYEDAKDLMEDILGKDEPDPQDLSVFWQLAGAAANYKDKRGNSIMNNGMGRGRLALVAGSWVSVFMASWLVILGAVDLWPTAAFIVLFIVIGSVSPFYSNDVIQRKDDS